MASKTLTRRQQSNQTKLGKKIKGPRCCKHPEPYNRDAETSQKVRVTIMLDQYLSTVYSEELFDFTEEEYAAVMADSADWQGYSEWSQELEQGQIVNTPHGEILINKECAHPACLTTRCEKGATYQGIAI